LVQKDQRFVVVTGPPEEPGPEPEPTPEPPPEEARTYTVQPGDSLALIAKQVYGKSHLWRIIFEANRNVLSDPRLIHPGQVLKIPPVPE
jgi:nucleoid-associated protein YgaU